VKFGSELDVIQRRESLKAGAIAATVALVFFGLFALGHQWLWHRFSWDWQLLLRAMMAGLSGGLFGITYRYAVRSTPNLQLKLGVVFAFGLVRACGQADVGIVLTNAFLTLTILGSESILLFAIAGTTLDVAMQQGWVKPFD
jgi:hypothetical protein